MRILIVDTYYPAFLASHYAENPSLLKASYAEQLRALLDRCFGTFDAYSHHFRALGHEAGELIANCVPLQFQWARENGGVPLRRSLQRAQAAPGRAGLAARHALLRLIARAQVSAFGADVVYMQDLSFFSRRELETIRRGGSLVAGQIASPPPGLDLLKRYDLVLSSFPHFVGRFQAVGIESAYLRIAFDERLLARVIANPAGNRAHKVVFVGGLHPGIHDKGTALLEEVATGTALDVWGYGIEALPEESELRRRHRGQAWGIDMYRILGDSKIVLNRHIDVAEGYANNMRLYEATGMGAMLVTEAAPNLQDLFDAGREVVVYDNARDLLDKVRYYLVHDEERFAIARAGQAHTLQEHTYAKRIKELVAILETRVRAK